MQGWPQSEASLGPWLSVRAHAKTVLRVKQVRSGPTFVITAAFASAERSRYAGPSVKGLLTAFSLAVTVALGLPASALAVAAASQPATIRADPAIGPHALAEAQYIGKSMHFATARSAIVPRVARGGAAGPLAAAPGSATLTREVMGFAPYWSLANNDQVGWNYSLVNTFAYFAIDMNYDGSFNQTLPSWQGWQSGQLTDMINRAHLAGDRVVLVIKAFDDATINGIVNTPANTQTAITNTINAVASKNLDGVNVDFEGSINAQYPNLQSGFTNFMTQLSSQVHQRWATAEVSADTYSGSASWDGGMFKIGDLAPVVDALFVMAYDMYSANMMANQAGPNAPLNGWTYNDTSSVAQYLSKAPASKILLGVPYYGYKWSVKTAQPYATTTSGAAADGYSDVLGDLGCAQSLKRHWDSTAQSPWATWFSPSANDPCGGNYNSWRELYYDDATSLGLKYDLVNSNGLRGTGMWELGFQGTSNDLWRMLAAKFGTTPSTFYFAEGYTGSGFSETLYLLSPGQSGNATIDYYTKTGHSTQTVSLTSGYTTTVNVNAAIGAGQDVSVRVSFPGQGVAERQLTFNNGTWHGSTQKVGASSPSSEWDFAEGSTLNPYSEYLTLENPNSSPVVTTLNYQTDGGAHPVKTLTLPGSSRTTVEVQSGDLSTNPACIPGAGGTCGIGHGIGGVSVQVKSAQPIIAERPFYVNNFSFGSGAIRDGHDAFGANSAATQWDFAEGTTLSGFNEFLTLQNPGLSAASVTLNYMDTSGHATVKTLGINPQTRATVPVFGSALGVGSGVSGVSVEVTSTQPIVAERPMYMVHDFGSGIVAGADDVVGATSATNLVQYARVTTAPGEYEYLTIENPGVVAAHVEVTYVTTSTVVAQLDVAPHSRQTAVLNNQGLGGVGPGQSLVETTLVSDQPVVVERPTYSSNTGDYGATDSMGYSPVGF